MLTTGSPRSITFAVNDVVPAKERLATVKTVEAIRGLLDAPPGAFAIDDTEQGSPTQGRIEACWHHRLDCVAGIGCHPLIAAAHLAFSGHRPLALSPDVIWVTIAQGLAQHIRLDAEAHRHLLVRHEGKLVLTVDRQDLHRGSPDNPWDEVVASFASQVRAEIGWFADRCLCDFSTTGPVERTVSEMVMLDLLQPYFSYHVACICGIPSVTLEGTPDDWRKLREKIELLAPFGLDWWLGELRAIGDEFVRAAAGEVDREHWSDLYKIQAVYGGEVINGWLGKLFPYTRELATQTFSRRNRLLDPQVDAEIRALATAGSAKKGRDLFSEVPGIKAEELPRGLSQVPFTFEERGKMTAMELLAGAAVVTQDVETGALRPVLGWAVREASPIEQAMLRIAEHDPETARAGDSRDARLPTRLRYVPTDALRLYRDVSTVLIRGSAGQATYRILPLAEWTRDEDDVTVNDFDYRFAECGDGTELLIRLFSYTDNHLGSIFIGRRHGAKISESGRRVARSFTDFLLRALNSVDEPYFQLPDFQLRD